MLRCSRAYPGQRSDTHGRNIGLRWFVARWRLFYHLVWATRDREPLITPTLQPHLYRHLSQIAQKYEILVHAIGGIEDHVHLAASIPPSLAVATAVRRIKGTSSRAINEEFGGGFGWQNEYGVNSFGEQHLRVVVAYIENQRRRHARGRIWPEAELSTPSDAKDRHR